MSEERERIAKLYKSKMVFWEGCWSSSEVQERRISDLIESTLSILHEFGWRQIPKLTLIGPKEIKDVFLRHYPKEIINMDSKNEVLMDMLQAQLNYDNETLKRQIGGK